MTREEILASIVESTEKLGRVPSHNELTESTNVKRRRIRSLFGTYAQALRECKLERRGGGWKVPMEKLFQDWATIVRKLKKLPSTSDYELLSEYCPRPLNTRFGSWKEVPTGLKRYMEEQGLGEEWKDVLDIVAEREVSEAERAWTLGPGTAPTMRHRILADRPIYGPLMRPYPLIHGPNNEAGVILLFGAKAEQLGFVVTLMQTGFPDCEASVV